MSESAPGHLLPWDSDFFGLRVARADASRLDDRSADALVAWARAEGVDCTYFLVDPDDRATIATARRTFETSMRA